jgi:flotillin
MKTINITAAAAEVAKQEKQIEIRERMVAVKQKELEAEVQKRAEADRQAQIQKSEAELYQQQKDAEAAKYKEERRAEAIKAVAEAEKQKAFAEAAAIQAKGEAEAAAVKAKGLAEAEALDKKAEAMKKYGDAARQEMQLKTLETYFHQMPAIAAAVAKPMEKIGNITMYGEGNTAKLTGDITKTLTQISSGLTDSMGIDLKTIISSMFGAKLAGVTPKAQEVPAETVETVRPENPTPNFQPDRNTSDIAMSQEEILRQAAILNGRRRNK